MDWISSVQHQIVPAMWGGDLLSLWQSSLLVGGIAEMEGLSPPKYSK
jgi:hypothetical protein